MDVQKYIKRLKFARADMSRATGPFETREEAVNFLNSREFFFGDPFIVKYKDRDDENKVKLLLAIGKSENPEITTASTEVSGGVGEDAYELIDVNDFKNQLDDLYNKISEEISARTESDELIRAAIDSEASARTEADSAIQEEIEDIKASINNINDLISDLSGETQGIKDAVGEGWVDSPDNVTITDRIKRDEELTGIKWGHYDGEPYDGHLDFTGAHTQGLSNYLDAVKVLDDAIFDEENATRELSEDVNSKYTEVNDKIDSSVDRLDEEIVSVSGLVSNEIENRISADEALQSNIDSLASNLNSRCDSMQEDVDAISDRVNVIASEISDMSNDITSLKATDGSFKLLYDKDAEEISLNWEIDGHDHISKINVSDFVKDSFLENVQVVTRDGVQYIEFRFKTYEGEPIPIYIPLTDLATIYHAGDGIDVDELVNNQVITVKIDEFGTFPNFLAKSANGLRVTGVTEYVDEAIQAALTGGTDNALTGVTTIGAGNVVSSISKNGQNVVAVMANVQAETDDHFDSASTNPVENRVITSAINSLNDRVGSIENEMDNFYEKNDIDQMFEEVSSSMSGMTEELREVIENEISERSSGDEVLQGQIDELKDIVGDGLSGMSLTDAVIQLQENMSEESSARTEADAELSEKIENLRDEIDDIADSLSAITSDTIVTNSLTANTIYANVYENLPTASTTNFGMVKVDDTFDSGSTNPIQNKEIYRVITEDERIVSAALNDLNDRKADISYVDGLISGMTIDVDDELDSASTNPVENRVLYQIITDDEEAIAGALNDLNARIDGISIDVDSELDSASTNPVENRVITRVLFENELVIASSLNDLNSRKADKEELSKYMPLSAATSSHSEELSDENLKIFMGDLEDALNKANRIPTKYFYWKDMCDGPRQIGTSAQKVQESFPEIVGKNGDRLTLDYSKLSVIALAAIKELSAKVEDLQRQIDELKK